MVGFELVTIATMLTCDKDCFAALATCIYGSLQSSRKKGLDKNVLFKNLKDLYAQRKLRVVTQQQPVS